MTSRVAKNPIKIPAGVQVTVAPKRVFIKGKFGELSQELPPEIQIEELNEFIGVKIANGAEDHTALAGTVRALLQNMVSGVSDGFSRKLVMIGVGYRAKAQGNTLDLSVGFSHPVVMKMPQGITVETPSNTEIVVKGANKQLVSQIAANIRGIRSPEPYKGKGIRYENEQIVLKEGKKK